MTEYIPELDYEKRDWKPLKQNFTNDLCGSCRSYYKMLYEKGLTTNPFPPSCNGHVLDALNHIKPGDFSTQDEYEQAQILLDPVAWAKQEFNWDHRWYQQNIASCTARMKIIRGGRRAGKSAVELVLILYEMMTQSNRKVLLLCPSEKLIGEFFDVIQEFISKSSNLRNSILRNTRNPHLIHLKNGSKLLGISISPNDPKAGDKARGFDASLFVIDEAELFKDEDMESIMALLVSNPETKVMISSTPKGWRKHFYKNCTKKDIGFKEFHFISAEKPGWTDQIENSLKLQFTASAYEQEFLASWGELEEGVFKKKYIERAMQIYNISNTEPTGGKYILGVDWNKSAGNHMVIVEVIDGVLKLIKKIIVPESEYMQTQSVQDIIDLHIKWKFKYIFLDKGYGCLDPSTLIQKSNGTLTRLANIKLGDLVLSSNGLYNKVVDIKKDISKPAFILKPNKCLPLILSDCHPTMIATLPNRYKSDLKTIEYSWKLPKEINTNTDFIVIAKEKFDCKPIDYIDILEHISKNNVQFNGTHVWNLNSFSINTEKSLKDLSNELQVSTATISRTRRKIKLKEPFTNLEDKISKYVKDFLPAQTKFKRFIKYDNDFQLLLGWYLSEGSAQFRAVEIDQKKSLYLKDFDYICEYAKRTFPNVTVIKTQSGVKRLIIPGKIATELFSSLCGKTSKGKVIHKTLMRSKDISGILCGLYYGDGHVAKKYNSLQLSLTSFDLINQIRQYFINNGILPSLYFSKGRGANHADQLRIDLSGDFSTTQKINELFGKNILKPTNGVNRKHFINLEDYILCSIISVKENGHKNDFIDIEVENTHNFTANGFLVHNSTQTEMLQKWAMNNPASGMMAALEAFAMNQHLEILDPTNGQPVKLMAKPYFVNQTAKLLEDGKIILPRSEDYTSLSSEPENASARVIGLVEQMRNYKVQSYSIYNQPRYSQGEDHTITAFMLACGGYVLKEGGLNKVSYSSRVIGVAVQTEPAVEKTRDEIEREIDLRKYKLTNTTGKAFRNKAPATVRNLDTLLRSKSNSAGKTYRPNLGKSGKNRNTF